MSLETDTMYLASEALLLCSFTALFIKKDVDHPFQQIRMASYISKSSVFNRATYSCKQNFGSLTWKEGR